MSVLDVQKHTGESSAAGPAAVGMVFPVLIVASVLVIIAPLPPLLMDLLLAANVTAAVVILLTTIYVERPLDFSVFPTILLATTLSRLVLNVASTRLILSRGGIDGTAAAGGVIEAFGRFVAGGSVAIGLTIFVIVFAIQFLVITRGATRIGEVAARFALDGLPGKQMAIDADLSAGLTTQDEARRRRDEVGRQADFYGAMDGAAKFVRGDALAGMVITLANIAAGLYFGMVEHGLPFGRAVEVFTTLTIGDGLVTQLPALLISLAAGLIVTRTSGRSNLPREAMGQLLRHPQALLLAAVFLGALSITGLPAIPMLMIGAGCGLLGWQLLDGRESRVESPERGRVGTAHHPPADTPIKVGDAHPTATLDALHVEPLELELGIGLIRLTRRSAARTGESGEPDGMGTAHPPADSPMSAGDAHSTVSISGGLLDHVARLRRQIARELGFVVPSVHIRDNLLLELRQYQVKLRGAVIARRELFPDGLLAVEAGEASRVGTAHHLLPDAPILVGDAHPTAAQRSTRAPLAGIETREPATGRPARWIEAADRSTAELAGYRVVDPMTVLMQDLAALIRRHAAELLTRQQVHQLLDGLRRRCGRLVDELVPHLLKPWQLHQVLCRLLAEGVPIRDLETIVERLVEAAGRTQNLALLTEHVRAALARSISDRHREHDGPLRVVAFEPRLEEVLAAGFDFDEQNVVTKLSTETSRRVVEALRSRSRGLLESGRARIVLCSPRVRPGLRRLIEAELPEVPVLSTAEVSRATHVETVETIPASILDPLTTDN